MKRIFLYMSMALAAAASLTSCSDDFDTPPMVVPTATATANTTIADFKARYWQDVNNYIDTIKDDVVIKGRVVSSDASGNIYKALYIADETGGLTISINGNSLYNTYRVGQEIVLPLKDLWVGKYNGQQQLGYPAWYSSGNVWEATFLPLATWQATAQLNGLPNVGAIDTIPLNLSELGTDSQSLLKWQGRLVRISNVKFVDANGTTTFANADATTNRSIQDENGNTLVTRNSNYASFRAAMLPLGTGDVVGVLSYYNTSRTSIAGGTWQLYLRDTDDCIGFSTSTKGLQTDPYNMEEVVANQNQGINGWMTGYVVGAVAPEVTSVTSNDDVEWTAPTTLDNTLVIGPTADTRDITKCVVVSLPQGTPFRNLANLRSNPDVLGSQIYVKGTFATYMGTNGITGNSGSTDEFVLTVVTGGVTELDEGFDGGIPSTWTSMQVSGDKAWYTTTFDNNTYAAMTGYRGTQPPFDSWLISPAIDVKNATNKTLSFRTQVNGYSSTTSKLEVYVMSLNDPTKATKIEQLDVALATAPSSGYSDWQASGTVDLTPYADGTYFIGFRYHATSDANYATWCVDDVKVGHDQAPVSNANRADLETLNAGKPSATYGNHTSTKGWVASNCSVLQGGAADANPVFTFIGTVTGSSDYAMAANLNGKTSAVGTLTSPTLTGGIAKLTFNYGYAYTESNGVSFRVDVVQGGQVVKTYTVTDANATRYTAYSFDEDVNITGDFQLVFTNLSPSASASNKDRVALWNISWTAPGASSKRARSRR